MKEKDLSFSFEFSNKTKISKKINELDKKSMSGKWYYRKNWLNRKKDFFLTLNTHEFLKMVKELSWMLHVSFCNFLWDRCVGEQHLLI